MSDRNTYVSQGAIRAVMVSAPVKGSYVWYQLVSLKMLVSVVTLTAGSPLEYKVAYSWKSTCLG